MAARAPHRVEKIDNLPLVLVAGGAGFLGSYLCASLLTRKLKVLCIDNLSIGKKKNIEGLLLNPAFSFKEGDLNAVSFVKEVKPDYIFHLAGVEEYINGEDVSLETLMVNSLGTKNLLELTKETKSKFLLVSSLSVYEGLLSSESLSQDFSLSQKELQSYSHHEAKRFSEALTAEYVRKFNLDARIVRIKDCYGPKMSLEVGSQISHLLKQAIKGESLTIEGEGLEVIHPTFVTDVVYGLEKAMFSQNTSAKVYTIANPEEITLVNFAYSLQKQSPLGLKIEFIPKTQEFKFSKKPIAIEKTQEDLGWAIKTTLDDGLKKTLEFFQSQNSSPPVEITPANAPEPEQEPKEPVGPLEPASQKPKSEETVASETKVQPMPEPIPETPKLIPKKNALPKVHVRFFVILASLILLTGALSLPVVSLAALTFLGTKDLTSSQKLLEQGKFVEAKKTSQNASNYFTKARSTINSLSWFFTIIKVRKQSSQLSESLEVGENLALAAVHIASAGSKLTKIKEEILLGFAPDTGKKITDARLEIEQADDKLALVQALGEERKFCPFNLELCTRADEIQKKIPEIRSLLAKSEKAVAILPRVLGSEGRKIYLLLFQNNMELRGTGGFIGSYGLITLENGKVEELKIEDIYSADGQLKGHIDPPDEILHFMGQPNWYLRDSNISPDFPLSAQRAIWFFEKETGILVDGVVAIDLSLIQKLLGVTGPVDLPDYKQTIDAKNLFSEAEKAAEVSFFPGSTQKKDFLGTLGRSLVIKIGENANQKMLDLLEVGDSSIKERHLQAFSQDKETQEVFKSIGLSGDLSKDTCAKKGNCLKSTLLLSENNIGANKANYFVKRTVQRIATIGKEGEVREKVTITYQNDSPTETWPGGPYKNWLRFYVPQKSKLLSLDLGDGKKATVSSQVTENILKKLKKDQFLVLEGTESGKTEWGVVVEVPILSQKTIKLVYELPNKFSIEDSGLTLEMEQQKQAGTEKDPLTLEIDYPAFLTLKEKEPKEALAKPQVVSYNSDLSVDRNLTVDFKR